MTKLVLAAGVAALAIAAPATAERGGHGGGNKAHAAKPTEVAAAKLTRRGPTVAARLTLPRPTGAVDSVSRR